MSSNIQRFVMAYVSDFQKALGEISDGRKLPGSHWMWYIFPQIAGLGKSELSVYYALQSLEEAKEFLSNQYLKNSLSKICEALLDCSDNIDEVFPYPDNLKIHSSITLFSICEPENEIFNSVLAKFWDGKPDELTVNIVKNMQSAVTQKASCKLKIIKGDITQFEGDAIVNAANSSLLGGGGVDGAIHAAAGPELLRECYTLNGCSTGNTKITKGYNLKAKWVLHTVGPVFFPPEHDRCASELKSCYKTSIALAVKYGVHSIAFPLISAGVYGYPKDEALEIAVKTIRTEAPSDMDVTICLFDLEAWEIAKRSYPDLCYQI